MSATPLSQPLATTEARRGTTVDRTILVCEDDKNLRVLIEIMLSQHGYRVLLAARPDEALEFAATHHGPIHLLITDLALQTMWGPELAKRLQTMRPEAEVLFVSGHSAADAGLPDEAAFLQKPFHPMTLLEKIRGLLAATRA